MCNNDLTALNTVEGAALCDGNVTVIPTGAQFGGNATVGTIGSTGTPGNATLTIAISGHTVAGCNGTWNISETEVLIGTESPDVAGCK